MARPVGVDISKYQAPQDLAKPHGINFSTMVDVADFLVVRAGFAGSAGGAWTDQRVHEYMKDLLTLLLNHPIPFTFYWYFRDNVSIMDQVNRFSAIVNRYKEVVNLPLVVDAEAFVKGSTVSTQKIKDFQFEVENQTGLKVDILYGRAGQLNFETVPGLEKVLPHLWVARYDTRLDPQVAEPWIEGGVQEYVEPRDYDKWTFWQYSEDGDEKKYGVTVGAIGIDENVYNGTMEELRAFAELDKPEPKPIDWDKWGTTTADRKLTTVGPGGTLLEFFSYDVNFEPQVLEIRGARGLKAKVSLFANGFEVLLGEASYFYRDRYLYTFRRDFNIVQGDGVLIELENTSDSAIEVKTTLVLEKYGTEN